MVLGSGSTNDGWLAAEEDRKSARGLRSTATPQSLPLILDVPGHPLCKRMSTRLSATRKGGATMIMTPTTTATADGSSSSAPPATTALTDPVSLSLHHTDGISLPWTCQRSS